MRTNNSDHRHIDRPEVTQSVAVLTSLEGQFLGNVVNIHAEGFMLIGDVPLNEEGVYQLIFQLSNPVLDRYRVTLGAECLWVRETGGGDQMWSGFQIIDISDEDREVVVLLGEGI